MECAFRTDFDVMMEMLTRAGIEFTRHIYVDADTTTLFTDEGHYGLWVLSGEGDRRPSVVLGFDVNDGSLKRVDTED